MEIRNFDAYSPLHKSGHTSKGDQLKWKIDDRWYKADYMGYEGLSKVANGKATKIIIPSELQNLGGVVPSIKELLTDPKDAE